MKNFKIGEFVYLKTDDEQLSRIITARTEREGGMTYAVAQGTIETWHYGFEMTRNKDLFKSLGLN